MDAFTVDENLILDKLKAAAETGDQAARDEAVGQLYILYRVRVLRWARVQTRSQQDAEDVAGMAWKRFWKEFNPEFSPDAFLRRLVKRSAIDFYRLRDAARANEPMRETEDGDDRNEADFVDPGDASDVLLQKIELCELILEVAFKSDPTHQRISFGFRNLLEWTPMEVVMQLSSEYLKSLCHKLRLDYSATSSIEPARLSRLFAPLCEDLKAVNERVMTHYKTRETWEPLLHRVAKDTKLEEYYIPRFGSIDTRCKNIAEWADKVRKKIILELRKRGIASR